MNNNNTLSITEARGKIFKIADEVQKGSNYYTLTERGRPKAVILSAAEFESWQETLEVMRDFPDLDKDIEGAEKDYKSGNYSALDEVLAEHGYVIADKGRKKYGLSRSPAKKGKKGIK